MTQPLALVHDEDAQWAHSAPGHPERPERVAAILAKVRGDPDLERVPVLDWQEVDPSGALLVHSEAHVARVEAVARDGGGWLDTDTYCTPGSFHVALASVSCAIRAVDAVLGAECRSVFVVARPPGHHATRDQAMGFCLFNNVAIAVAQARRAGVSRVCVIDIDVHHGNGTQDIFYDDPSVLYCSLHEYPWYPGTGAAAETGGPDALGCTVNVPVTAGTSGDEWLALFDERVAPAVEAFAPELLLVSAGFDAHAADPLAELNLTERTYAAVTDRVRDLSERHAGGRSVWLLEGGYDLDALAGSAAACMRGLAA